VQALYEVSLLDYTLSAGKKLLSSRLCRGEGVIIISLSFLLCRGVGVF
jgi:hypothetical protein